MCSSDLDVYRNQPTFYAQAKKYIESTLAKEDLILRCPMLLGYTMKPNHATKLISNKPKIGLSSESTFNYTLMKDLTRYFREDWYLQQEGVVDFVSTDTIKLVDLKAYFNSKTELGNFTYINNQSDYKNPIYKIHPEFTRTSFEIIKYYFN